MSRRPAAANNRTKPQCSKAVPDSSNPPVKGPFCSRCRNHGLNTPRKGHAECPFNDCECADGCFLVKQRKLILEEQNKLKRKERLQSGSCAKRAKKLHSTIKPTATSAAEEQWSVTVANQINTSPSTTCSVKPQSRTSRANLTGTITSPACATASCKQQSRTPEPISVTNTPLPSIKDTYITRRCIAVLGKVFPEHSIHTIMAFIDNNSGDLLSILEQMVTYREFHLDSCHLPTPPPPSNVHAVAMGFHGSYDNCRMMGPPTDHTDSPHQTVDLSVRRNMPLTPPIMPASLAQSYSPSNNYSSYMQIPRDQNFSNTVVDEIARNLAYRSMSREDLANYVPTNGFQNCGGNGRTSFERPCVGQVRPTVEQNQNVGWWMSDVLGPAAQCARVDQGQMTVTKETPSVAEQSQSTAYVDTCDSPEAMDNSKLDDDDLECLSEDQDDVSLDNITPTLSTKDSRLE